MLDIFKDIKPFFEDVFRETSVREYARIRKVSPPTASSLLKRLAEEQVLIMRKDRNLLLFRANKEFFLFRDLAISFWKYVIGEAFKPLREDLLYKRLILFGSVQKVENTSNSDIDIFINIPRKNIDLLVVEKALKRKVQLHFSDSLRNEHLKKNIEKGVEII